MAGPGKGRRGVTPKELKETFTSKSLLRIVKLVLKHYWVHLVIVFICIIVAAVASVRGTLFTQTLIDDYIMPMIGVDNPDFGPLINAMTKVAVFYLIGAGCSLAYNLIMTRVGQGTLKRLRGMLFTRMEKLPIRYFDTHPYGDIMSVYTNDTDTLREFIGRSFPETVNLLATLISTLVSMIILSIPLTIISLILVSSIVIITIKITGLSGKHFGEQQKNIGIINGFIEEMMSGQKVIKVFTHEQKTIEAMDELNVTLRKSSNSAHGVANILMPICAQIGNLNYVIVAVIGAIFAMNGKFAVTIGVLVSFMTLNKNFNRPFTQLSMQLNSIVMAAAGAERVYELYDQLPEVDEGVNTIVDSAESGDIVFDNVDFRYAEDRIQILFGINMYAHKGQKIALVGSTGAGKTTIANLINRFYDIQNGSIKYDGVDLREIKKDSLRGNIGVVLQETNLFTGTVMDNIRYGRLDATDAECRKAAILANADGFIRRLPEGYNTVITGNGANLSQGQRQLIAIARAAIADPKVLILDEATSSIDTRTESLVQKGMDSLMKGRTTFVIAHRLSTIKNADCIMVLENGHIIERGTHDELLDQKGRYYQLYTGNIA